MYSLSVLSKIKKVKFDYYVDHIASFIKENPSGNYKKALENEVNFIELNLGKDKTLTQWIKEQSFKDNEIVIEEGARVKEAEYGIKLLSDEIRSWADENKIDKLNIFLPSGTGTTALYLQKNSKFDIYTTPSVGDAEYLRKQFFMLEEEKKFFPNILTMDKKYHFAKLYKENYEIYLELLDKTNIEFDLLYDCLGWRCLLNALKSNKIDLKAPIMYIHQGGINGNITMIERYKRKFL